MTENVNLALLTPEFSAVNFQISQCVWTSEVLHELFLAAGCGQYLKGIARCNRNQSGPELDFVFLKHTRQTSIVKKKHLMLQWVIAAFTPSPTWDRKCNIVGSSVRVTRPGTHPGKSTLVSGQFLMSQHISNTLFLFSLQPAVIRVSEALRTQAWTGLLHSEKSFPIYMKNGWGMWHSKCAKKIYDNNWFGFWQKPCKWNCEHSHTSHVHVHSRLSSTR